MIAHRIAAVVLLISLSLPAMAAVHPGNNALAARGFNELYNMEYDPAIRDFTKLRTEFPDDPFPVNYLLGAQIFKELNRIGALDTETYSGDNFLTSKPRRPLCSAAYAS